MERKLVFGVMLAALLAGMSVSVFNFGTTVVQVGAQSTTTLAVDPPALVVPIGHTFNLTLTITDVIDLYGYEIMVWYNTTVLDVLRAETGGFLGPRAYQPVSAYYYNDAYNSTHGRLWLVECGLAPFPGKSGSGVLYTMTFNSTALGRTSVKIWTPAFCGSAALYPAKLGTAYGPTSEYPGIPHIAIDGEVIVVPLVTATVNLDPDTLNLRSKVVSAYIEFPEGYNISDIDASSILLNGTLPVDMKAPKTVGDYDNDAVPDLMVKFDGAKVISYILANVNMTELIEKRFMTITLTITGQLIDGTPFEGSDSTIIIYNMPRGFGKGLWISVVPI